jgi:Transglycosylase SLT domain
VFRSLTIIIAAMLLARPGMSRDEAASYATVLQQEAKDHGFDPFTGVALIRRESRWQARAVSPDGEDYGLAQIRARYIGACRSDPDPLHAPSEACQQVKRSLLNGAYNIRVMATLITRNRALCKDKTGTALFGQWLASYEGRNYPGSDKWCQPAEGTQEVIQYQRWLVSKLAPPKPKASPRTATAKRADADGRSRGKRRVKPRRATPERDKKRASGSKHRR